MKVFSYAHATHPQWQMAASLVLAQLRAQMANPQHAPAPTLALLYITDHFAQDAKELLDYLSGELPTVTDWSGTVGIGIATNNAEYFDEPALAVMLLDLPGDQYRVFSGVSPLGMAFEAHTALVHADPSTAELGELLTEMSARTDSGYLFGGLASSRSASVQFALAADGNVRGQGHAGGVFSGGLSGVAFGPDVGLVSRVTQGCKPVSQTRVVTDCQDNVVLTLNSEPALEVLLNDLSVSLSEPQEALQAVRATLAGMAQPPTGSDSAAVRKTGNFGSDVLVRHIIGLDPGRQAIAIGDHVHLGAQLTFCQRNVQAARMDLTRICAEIREELEPEEMLEPLLAGVAPDAHSTAMRPARHITGAIYVSCTGRGGPHFGGSSAEMQIVRRALGDVPLVGFFAAGEVAHHHLYAYTGVLTVFTAET
ncbi:MAG: FIST N-terminal domain-containing protein [Rhodoferax sp.]